MNRIVLGPQDNVYINLYFEEAKKNFSQLIRNDWRNFKWNLQTAYLYIIDPVSIEKNYFLGYKGARESLLKMLLLWDQRSHFHNYCGTNYTHTLAQLRPLLHAAKFFRNFNWQTLPTTSNGLGTGYTYTLGHTIYIGNWIIRHSLHTATLFHETMKLILCTDQLMTGSICCCRDLR